MKAVFVPQWLFPLSLSLGAEEAYISPPRSPKPSSLCLLGLQLSRLVMGRDSKTYPQAVTPQAVTVPASMTACASTEEL